jgi:methylthioribose-1-phosphate isomerase
MLTVEWANDGVRMIDQRHLPWELTHREFHDYRDVAKAITDMVVRGAPAIGATAALGMALAAQNSTAATAEALCRDLEEAGITMKAARPTAVNLAWGTDQIVTLARRLAEQKLDAAAIRAALLAEGQRIAAADIAINKALGKVGMALINDGDTVLHHCNTGALAAVDYGTALGVIRSAYEHGKRFHVLLTETRPRMQGARLSAWELHNLGIPFEIIPDSAAGFYMNRGEVKLVLVGADRVAANGDTVNKIGTYMLSVLARENGVPFYPVVPTSTIDYAIETGAAIPIEERSADEVRRPYGHDLIPVAYPVRNPAFDVTPARNLSGIVTEFGIVSAPLTENLAKLTQGQPRSAPAESRLA